MTNDEVVKINNKVIIILYIIGLFLVPIAIIGVYHLALMPFHSEMEEFWLLSMISLFHISFIFIYSLPLIRENKFYIKYNWVWIILLTITNISMFIFTKDIWVKW